MADIPDIRNFPKERPDLRGSPKGLLDLWMKDNIDWMESCIPAIFLGYQNNDRNTGFGIIRPLIQKKSPDGTVTDRGRYLLPIRQFQHGTFMINAPLVEGDTGWIVAGDRDNSNAIEVNSMIQGRESGIGKKGARGVPIGNEGPQPPNQFDSHKYIYGFFLPDKWGGVPLPPIMKDSLVIGQVNPDASSYGRFVMDPDGTIHVLSRRWYDAKEPDPQKRLKGGAIFVDLSWKGRLPTEPVETWRLGENNVTATEIIWGNLVVREWEDPDGYKHGGSAEVQHGATVGGSLLVKNGARVENGLGVEGNTDINGRVVIKHDTSRTVTIDGHDLINGDAKFVKKTIVTGKDRNRSHGGKVYLTTEETYVLADKGRETQPIELSDIAGGGGDALADNLSVDYGKMHSDGQEYLEFKKFQTDDLETETTLQDDEEACADAGTDASGKDKSPIGYEVVVRDYTEDKEKREVRYKPVGHLVTGIIPDGEVGEAKFGAVDLVAPVSKGGVENDLEIEAQAGQGKNGIEFFVPHRRDGTDGQDGKDAGIDIDTEEISGDPGGTRVTLTPTEDGEPVPEKAKTFDVMNGRDGQGGGVAFTYVAKVRYNMETHKLEQLFVSVDAQGNKTITSNPDAIVAQAQDADWVEITEAVAHSQTVL